MALHPGSADLHFTQCRPEAPGRSGQEVSTLLGPAGSRLAFEDQPRPVKWTYPPVFWGVAGLVEVHTLVCIAGPQISGVRPACFEGSLSVCYALGDACSWGFSVHPPTSERHRLSQQGSSPRHSPEVCSVWSRLQVTRWSCPSEYLNTPFSFSSLQDDDHFSPEADAAMSEMTGNTALLAQVCGWGRRLAAARGSVEPST